MRDFIYDGRPSIVVTSISAPNPILREFAARCEAHGFSFFLVGDAKSPAHFQLSGCEFYDLNRQRETGFKIAGLLPTGHYARKNIGYLLSMQSRACLIHETDDDNLPLAAFWAPKTRKQRVPRLSKPGWVNIYAYFSVENVWPRGLPLDAIHESLPEFESLPEAEMDCPIQQGLADENPDVDAIYRLTLPLPLCFRQNRSVAPGPGAWCPFNSQNTAWFPDAYPLLYLPSYCSFRMTDIWRSFVAQRIAWENGWSVLFRSPDVVQERNEHNLMRDFADEIPGYLHNRMLAEKLNALKLKPGREHLSGNLICCYEELIRSGVVDPKEMPLLEAWIDDVNSIS